MNCPADPAAGIVERLFGVVDCHIRVIAHDSYRDLVGPGTLFANVFTVMLTIYIAVMGYQLLFGRGGLRLAQMPIEALKIGLILAFTTSWAAYQTVVYDLFFDGPREILGLVLRAAGQGDSGDLYLGLQNAYQRLAEVASTYGAMASPSANILQGGPMLGSGLLWFSAVAMLLATVGLILAAKIVLGVLLALGPIFVGLFLFETTRGFFDGWLRMTVAFALAPLAASLIGAGLLMMLDPFLATLSELAAQRRFDMGAVITVLLIVAVFVIVMLQALRVSFGIASGFKSNIAPAWPTAHRGFAAAEPNQQPTPSLTERSSEPGLRAAEVSERIAAQDLRLTRLGPSAERDAPREASRLGQSYRRMPRPTRRTGDSE
jgi:type IV secretion system protein VirB6